MNNQLEDSHTAARLAFWGAIIAAIISVIGVGGSAYLKYLSDTMPFYATQTMAAEMTQNASITTVIPSRTPDLPEIAEVSITTATPPVYNIPIQLEAEQKSVIAFVRFWDTKMTKPSIFLINADGGNEKQLTSASFNSRDPSWSPDGNWIIFSSDKDGDYELYLMNPNIVDLNGENWIQLTSNTTSDRGPSWSPDGRWIAYYSPHDEKQSEIYIFSVNDQSVRQVTFNNVYDRYPSWSPDSQSLIFQSLENSKWNVKVMDLNGNIISTRAFPHEDVWWPSWSPDGKYISYTKGDYSGSANVSIYDLTTGMETQLTSKISSAEDWSYNSKQLVLSCWDSTPKIWIMDADGQNGRQLTFDEYSDTQPVWYP